jgi:hypothetical protein
MWFNELGQRVRKTGHDTTYYVYDGIKTPVIM